jgi:hypothetical protein
VEGTAESLGGSEAFEGQVQDCGPHLLSEPTTLVITAQPGSGLHRSDRREVLGHEILHPDQTSIHEDRPRERPVLGAPVGPG